MTSTVEKGTRWATKVAEMLRGIGLVSRKAWMSPGDDMTVILDQATLSVEAKDEAAWKPADWLNQAERQAPSGSLPIVVAHRRGHADAEHGYVIMSGQTFVALVKRLR